MLFRETEKNRILDTISFKTISANKKTVDKNESTLIPKLVKKPCLLKEHANLQLYILLANR